jgi:hypothetical protein
MMANETIESRLLYHCEEINKLMFESTLDQRKVLLVLDQQDRKHSVLKVTFVDLTLEGTQGLLLDDPPALLLKPNLNKQTTNTPLEHTPLEHTLVTNAPIKHTLVTNAPIKHTLSRDSTNNSSRKIVEVDTFKNRNDAVANAKCRDSTTNSSRKIVEVDTFKNRNDAVANAKCRDSTTNSSRNIVEVDTFKNRNDAVANATISPSTEPAAHSPSNSSILKEVSAR